MQRTSSGSNFWGRHLSTAMAMGLGNMLIQGLDVASQIQKLQGYTAKY